MQEQNPSFVRVEYIVTVQLFSETPVLVASSTRGLMQLDALAGFEQNYPCEVSRGVMDTPPLCLFYTLLANRSNTIVKLAKRQSVALTNTLPVENMHIKDDERSTYLPVRARVESVNIVHYKLTSDRLQET